MKIEETLLSKKEQRPSSWMICTARQAMKKHWIEVGLWILQTKFCNRQKTYGFALAQNRTAI